MGKSQKSRHNNFYPWDSSKMKQDQSILPAQFKNYGKFSVYRQSNTPRLNSDPLVFCSRKV